VTNLPGNLMQNNVSFGLTTQKGSGRNLIQGQSEISLDAISKDASTSQLALPTKKPGRPPKDLNKYFKDSDIQIKSWRDQAKDKSKSLDERKSLRNKANALEKRVQTKRKMIDA
jgi:hypothetical protein